MTALIITLISLVYLAAATHTARLLAGSNRYQNYLSTQKNLYSYERATPYEEWQPRYPGEIVVGACAVAYLALPVAWVILATRRNGGTFHIDPKQVRQQRQIKAKDERIKELEAALEIER